jgi:hypothetical protein
MFGVVAPLVLMLDLAWRSPDLRGPKLMPNMNFGFCSAPSINRTIDQWLALLTNGIERWMVQTVYSIDIYEILKPSCRLFKW